MFTPLNNRDWLIDTEKAHQWMNLALNEALKALPSDIPIGSVVIQNTGQGFKLLSTAYNTRERDCCPSAHAEIRAIDLAAKAKGNWRLDDCLVVVTLEPCAMCMGLILQSRVHTVIYGASSPLDGALGSRLNLAKVSEQTSPKVIAGILENECETLLKKFFDAQRLA